jgi:hypothetical protein
MIYDYGCDILRRKRNLLKSTDLDNTALARNHLIERPAVLEFHRDNLVTDARLRNARQVIDTSTRNRN